MNPNKLIISFLITHYNRSDDLEYCVKSILDLNLTNYEIIVSDDGSDLEHVEKIKSFRIDKLLLWDQNQGLASNLNKGIAFCEGNYLIYCQEDFKLDHNLKTIINECMSLLCTDDVDLIRFTSNFKFKNLYSLTENISIIPKFSWKNILTNYYQYSDHPFITTKMFFEKYGYYMENTSGRYGEMEYAIRIFKSHAKIAITLSNMAYKIPGSSSILEKENEGKWDLKINKSIHKILRAVRLYFEFILYTPSCRGLITYKNLR